MLIFKYFWGGLIFGFSCMCRITVQQGKIELQSATHLQVQHSTAILNFSLSIDEFDCYWLINNTNQVLCSNRGGSPACAVIPGSPYTDRISALGSFSSNPRVLYLNLSVLLEDFVTTISTKVLNVDISDAVSYQAVADCFIVDGSSNSFNSSNVIPCGGLGCNTTVDCNVGYIGLATAVCQADATYAITDNCAVVTCNVTVLNLFGCEPTDSSVTVVTYDSYIDASCSGISSCARCNATGGWEIVSIPENEIQFNTNTGIKVQNTDFKISYGIYPADFKIVFVINTTDVASCQYDESTNSSSCLNESSQFESRIKTTVEFDNLSKKVVRFMLTFGPLSVSDGHMFIGALACGGKLLPGTEISVVSDCTHCSTCPESIDASKGGNCGLGETCNIDCNIGYSGSANVTCQEDGTFFIENNMCVPVECNSSHLPDCFLTCVDLNTIFNYNENVTCNNSLAVCNSFGEWNATCVSGKGLVWNSTDTGKQVVGSSATLSIDFDISDFEIFWTANNTVISYCNYFSSSRTGQYSIASNDFQDRMFFSIETLDVVTIKLEIKNLDFSYNGLKIGVSTFDTRIGEVSLVIEECNKTSNTGVNLFEDCNYPCFIDTNCTNGLVGQQTITCEQDGTYTVHGICAENTVVTRFKGSLSEGEEIAVGVCCSIGGVLLGLLIMWFIRRPKNTVCCSCSDSKEKKPQDYVGPGHAETRLSREIE